MTAPFTDLLTRPVVRALTDLFTDGLRSPIFISHFPDMRHRRYDFLIVLENMKLIHHHFTEPLMSPDTKYLPKAM